MVEFNNMEKIIPKEKAEKLMNLKGEVKGIAIKSDMEFILKKKGKDGLAKLEKAMADLGHPIEYEKVRTMDFYPMGFLALLTPVVEKLFNFKKEDFIEMGRFAAKFHQL